MSGDALGAGPADDPPGRSLRHRCAWLSLRRTGYCAAGRAGAGAQAAAPTLGQLIGAPPCAKGSRGAGRTCRLAFSLRRSWHAALQPGRTVGVRITPDMAAIAAEICVLQGSDRACTTFARPHGYPLR